MFSVARYTPPLGRSSTSSYFTMDSKSESSFKSEPAVAVLESGGNGTLLVAENYNYTVEQVDNYVLDPEICKTVLRKYDRRILPVIFFMYLFSALDRYVFRRIASRYTILM